MNDIEDYNYDFLRTILAIATIVIIVSGIIVALALIFPLK